MWVETIRRQWMGFVSGSIVGAILLSALIVSAGTLKGQIEGDLQVNTNGTPNYITGNNGDLYVKDQLEVDGSANVAGDTSVSGKIGIGVSSPVVKLDIRGFGAPGLIGSVANEGSSTAVFLDNANSTPSTQYNCLVFRGSRGTLASPSLQASGDFIGSVRGATYNSGVYYNTCANINFQIDGNTGAGDLPTRITFETTPDGSGGYQERMRITNSGKVGIGNTSPNELMTLNGAISFQSMTAPTGTTGYGKIYAAGSSPTRMYAMDGSGNANPISSHTDPREVVPDVDTSFADPKVEMPFSFSHTNSFMGTGEVVDMAWLVRDVEKITGKQYRHLYQLPQDQVVNLSEWQQKEVTRLTQEAKERILATTPDVEIPLSEAYIEVPEVEVVEATRTHTEYKLDLENLTVAQVEVAEKTLAEVPTGKIKRQLKEDIRFDPETGKLFRRRTLDEIDPGVIPVPEIPEWVKSRIPSPK